MNKNLGLLIAQGFDFDLFWHVSFTQFEIALTGYNTIKLKKYILSKGFEQYNYLYENNKKTLEFKKQGFRIVLTPKSK